MSDKTKAELIQELEETKAELKAKTAEAGRLKGQLTREKNKFNEPKEIVAKLLDLDKDIKIDLARYVRTTQEGWKLLVLINHSSF